MLEQPNNPGIRLTPPAAGSAVIAPTAAARLVGPKDPTRDDFAVDADRKRTCRPTLLLLESACRLERLVTAGACARSLASEFEASRPRSAPPAPTYEELALACGRSSRTSPVGAATRRCPLPNRPSAAQPRSQQEGVSGCDDLAENPRRSVCPDLTSRRVPVNTEPSVLDL